MLIVTSGMFFRQNLNPIYIMLSSNGSVLSAVWRTQFDLNQQEVRQDSLLKTKEMLTLAMVVTIVYFYPFLPLL